MLYDTAKVPHMSQIVEELTFVFFSVTRFETLWCSCNFLEILKEAKVVPFISALASSAVTMLVGLIER